MPDDPLMASRWPNAGWWALLALGVVLACILVVVGVAGLLRRRVQHVPLSALELARTTAEQEVQAVLSEHVHGRLDGQGSARKLGGVLRRFLTAAGGADVRGTSANQFTVQAVADHRLEQAAHLLQEVAAVGFSPTADVDVPDLGGRALEVVDSWHS